MELLACKRLLPLLSNPTICKLSNSHLYNEDILNNYFLDITEYLDRLDINSIKSIQSELNFKKQEFSDIFVKRFSLLNDIHFKLKEVIESEITMHYNQNKDANKDITIYKDIESNVLTNLKNVLQEDVLSSEKNANTYELLSIIVDEVVHNLQYKTIEARCV